MKSGNDPCQHCEIAQVCRLRNLLRRGLQSHRVTAERDGGFLAGGAHPGHLPLSGRNSGLAMVSGHGMPQIAEVARAPLPQHGVKQRFEPKHFAQGRAELVVTNVDKLLVFAKRLGRPRDSLFAWNAAENFPTSWSAINDTRRRRALSGEVASSWAIACSLQEGCD